MLLKSTNAGTCVLANLHWITVLDQSITLYGTADNMYIKYFKNIRFRLIDYFKFVYGHAGSS